MPSPAISKSDLRAALDAMVAEAASKRLVVNGRIACPKPRYLSEDDEPNWPAKE